MENNGNDLMQVSKQDLVDLVKITMSADPNFVIAHPDFPEEFVSYLETDYWKENEGNSYAISKFDELAELGRQKTEISLAYAERPYLDDGM